MKWLIALALTGIVLALILTTIAALFNQKNDKDYGEDE
jgi:hypothetical protein